MYPDSYLHSSITLSVAGRGLQDAAHLRRIRRARQLSALQHECPLWRAHLTRAEDCAISENLHNRDKKQKQNARILRNLKNSDEHPI